MLIMISRSCVEDVPRTSVTSTTTVTATTTTLPTRVVPFARCRKTMKNVGII